MTIIEQTYDWASTPSARKSTEVIILHHMAGNGTAEDIHRIHIRNGWSGIGYHFLIRKDGSIYRGRPENCIGAHTSGHNSNSIGVCFEGNFETDTMADAQFSAGVELLEYLLDKYGDIPIKRHKDFNATACPGKNFPFDRMKGETDMTQEKFNEMADSWLASLGKKAPSSWSEEAREWAESNGLIKGDADGNLQYKRPLTREEYVEMEYRQSKK